MENAGEGETAVIELLATAQSVSADQVVTPAALGVGIGAIAIGLLIGAAIGGLIVGLILKLVAQAVLGYTVRYGSCFLAIFVVTLIQGVIGIALLYQGMVTMGDIQAAQQGGINAIMPYGLTVFAISQVIGILILTWAIRTFVKSPNDSSPPWGSSFVIAIIMAVIGIAVNFALAQLGVGR